jgi:hypothetical protein
LCLSLHAANPTSALPRTPARAYRSRVGQVEPWPFPSRRTPPP